MDQEFFKFYKLSFITIGRASGQKTGATSYHHGYSDLILRLGQKMNGPNKFVSSHIHPISEAEYTRNTGKAY